MSRAVPGDSEASGRVWRCRDRALSLSHGALVMGIVNVTPDSFSDGGQFATTEAAIAHALRLADEGADLLDIGGESTRPGAEPVPPGEELRRFLPVIEALAGRTECLISVDTTKAEVARQAIAAGAHVVNDVSAMTADPDMLEVAAKAGVGVVLMHRQGTPETMQDNPSYGDVVREVCGFLAQRAAAAMQGGVHRSSIVIDPGIGFGKTTEHNLALLRSIPSLRAIGFPVLIGASRKRMIGELLDRRVDARLAGSLALHTFALLQGAAVIRAHDVKETCDCARLLDKLTLHEA